MSIGETLSFASKNLKTKSCRIDWHNFYINTNAFKFVTAFTPSFILSPEGRGLGEGGRSGM